jgi:hypothetical protein
MRKINTYLKHSVENKLIIAEHHVGVGDVFEILLPMGLRID